MDGVASEDLVPGDVLVIPPAQVSCSLVMLLSSAVRPLSMKLYNYAYRSVLCVSYNGQTLDPGHVSLQAKTSYNRNTVV